MAENLRQSYSEKSPKTDFYINNPGKAVGDFCLGFFGIWVVDTIVWFLLAGVFSTLNAGILGNFFVSIFIILILPFIIFPIIFFNIGRRYVAIGILSSLVLPLIIFGACLIIISGLGGF